MVGNIGGVVPGGALAAIVVGVGALSSRRIVGELGYTVDLHLGGSPWTPYAYNPNPLRKPPSFSTTAQPPVALPSLFPHPPVANRPGLPPAKPPSSPNHPLQNHTLHL